MLPTIDWEDGEVVMVDQRKLPAREVYVRCRTATAIRTMVIRGAPAIGVAAAMGVTLELRRSSASGTAQLATEFGVLMPGDDDMTIIKWGGVESLIGNGAVHRCMNECANRASDINPHMDGSSIPFE